MLSAPAGVRTTDGRSAMLLEPQMRLPLERHIIPLLSADALASLACTCTSLRYIMDSELLDNQWWLKTAAESLGPKHPVLQEQHAPPSTDAMRAALIRYGGASARMQAGEFIMSECCFLVLTHCYSGK